MKNFAKNMVLVLLAGMCVILTASAQALSNDSPTEAYKRLFVAVKGKDTEAIKQQMTMKSIEFAGMAAKKNNTSIDKVFEHGFTATTFVESMPDIRDQRIKENMGAVAVWNAKDKRWEDLPFIFEDGSWKLAIGEIFAGTYKSPGPGQDAREKRAQSPGQGGIRPSPTPPAKPKPAAPYKISAIKILEFDENSGKFGEEVTKDTFFGNDISTSLFVTVELSGEGYVPKRNVQLTVLEGRKVKISRLAMPGILGDDGKYYIPLWIYGPICDNLKIRATVTGQTTRATMSRTINAHCGE